MSNVWYLLCFCVGIVVVILFVRRWILWSAERKLRAAVSSRLDSFITQAEDQEKNPLNDIHIETCVYGAGRRQLVETYYHVYPNSAYARPLQMYFFSFKRVVGRKGTTYMLHRWHHELTAPDFPPWPGTPCRSAWFVDRMKKLCDLIDAYPREALLNERAWAEWVDDEAEYGHDDPAEGTVITDDDKDPSSGAA